MTNIIVTGGAGFLGSHLCGQLLNRHQADDMKIQCIDNLYTGNLNNIRYYNMLNKFKFILHDIISPLHIEDVDQIYNLACPAAPIHYQKDPVATIKTAIIGTANMLELARKNDAKILQASTSEVYGDPLKHPQSELDRGNVNCTGPRACYDEGKRAAETLCFDYARQYGLRIKVVRIFNTYGPRMAYNDGRVIPNFITQALLDKPITIYGEGGQTRSFCYVSDMVDGFIKMMDSNDNFTGPVNLGNPDEITIMELAKEIKLLTKSKSKFIFKDFPQDDPIRRNPNIFKAMKNLLWEPKIKLGDGLLETIEYFKRVIYNESFRG